MPGIDAPKEAPKDPTQQLGEFMPDANKLDNKDKPKLRYETPPFSDEDLDKIVGKPRKELSNEEKKDFAEIIEQAKDAIKNEAEDGEIGHRDKKEFDIDGVEYVYLRDESKKVAADKDRLFKKA